MLFRKVEAARDTALRQFVLRSAPKWIVLRDRSGRHRPVMLGSKSEIDASCELGEDQVIGEPAMFIEANKLAGQLNAIWEVHNA